MTQPFNFEQALKELQAGKSLTGKDSILGPLIKQLSMFSMGMGYRDINQHVEEMYGINVSSETINAITDKLIPELKAWQQRPLDSHYPIVWLDAIHYKVKEDGRYISKAVYTLLALNMKGKRKFWGFIYLRMKALITGYLC